jgi:TctA family transporter
VVVVVGVMDGEEVFVVVIGLILMGNKLFEFDRQAGEGGQKKRKEREAKMEVRGFEQYWSGLVCWSVVVVELRVCLVVLQ